MSMIFQRSTEVNKNLTSNHIMLNSWGIISFFNLFIISMVLLTMYFEYGKGDNTLARHFVKWELPMTIFDTIG